MALTAGALDITGAAWPTAPVAVETTVIGVANALSTAIKFVAMRSWIFVDHDRADEEDRVVATDPTAREMEEVH